MRRARPVAALAHRLGLRTVILPVDKTITKLTTDHQQKSDAANRQIEALKVRYDLKLLGE